MQPFRLILKASKNLVLLWHRVDLRGLMLILPASVLLSACGGGTSGQSADPTVEEQPIAYVKRPAPLDANLDPDSGDVRRPTDMNPGAHLYIKSAAQLNASEIDISNLIIGDLGDVKDPEFSVDGTKLVFALRMEDDNMGADETWDIYIYDRGLAVSTTNPRRLIVDPDIAADGQDMAPHFLPDGRIIYSSTRGARTKAIEVDEGNQQFSPTIDAANSNVQAINLHVMSDTGTGIKQLTFNMSHDLDPAILNGTGLTGYDGRIIFTRWENVGNRNQMSLYTMNPDGSDVRHLYGAHSHNTGTNNSAIQFMHPRETGNGSVMVLARPFTGTLDGGDIVIIDIATYIDNTIPTNANAGLTGPAQTSASNNTVNTQPGNSLGGRFNSVFPLNDGSDRSLVTYSLCYVEITDPIAMTSEIKTCNAQGVDLTDVNTVPTSPTYGVFIHNPGNNTVLPVTLAEVNFYYTDAVVALNAGRPTYIPDSFDETTSPVGILHIRSVYETDGAFNALGGTRTTIGEYANPAMSLAADRPARFIRITKGVYLPDNTTRNFNGAAFGVNSGQLMKEIIGYAPIEPDGSVRVQIPADVPISFSIVDANGRRIVGSSRHNNWLTVRPGQTITCNGCHDHASGAPHGRMDAQPTAVNTGAPFVATEFTNTVTTYNTDITAGVTMAEARTINIGTLALRPSVDISYSDDWTDAAAAARAADASFDYSYSSMTLFDQTNGTVAPVNRQSCVNTWTQLCRIIINYETHIHPLWGVARVDAAATDVTCTNCHTGDNAGTAVVPAGQLDLTAGASDLNILHFKSYRELVSSDDQVEVVGNALEDVAGPITVPNSINVGSANGSPRFFNIFLSTAGANRHCTDDGMAVCQPWLNVHEQKMVSEWIDIGGQYYNDPFIAPLN